MEQEHRLWILQTSDPWSGDEKPKFYKTDRGVRKAIWQLALAASATGDGSMIEIEQEPDEITLSDGQGWEATAKVILKHKGFAQPDKSGKHLQARIELRNLMVTTISEVERFLKYSARIRKAENGSEVAAVMRAAETLSDDLFFKLTVMAHRQMAQIKGEE